MMNQYDRHLITLAEKLDNIDWGMAYTYMDQAESPEAKQILKDIAVRLYHNEEYLSDNL